MKFGIKMDWEMCGELNFCGILCWVWLDCLGWWIGKLECENVGEWCEIWGGWRRC